MNIRAIPTRYNGCIFRSRLEARWAVYFDALSIKYLYEYEGYQLNSGERYLPDFFLPDHRVYAEVKPYDQEDQRWYDFVRETGNTLVLLIGNPSPKPCRTIQYWEGSVYESAPFGLVANGDKFFPIYYAGGMDDTYLGGSLYQEAVSKAISERFGT